MAPSSTRSQLGPDNNDHRNSPPSNTTSRRASNSSGHTRRHRQQGHSHTATASQTDGDGDEDNNAAAATAATNGAGADSSAADDQDPFAYEEGSDSYQPLLTSSVLQHRLEGGLRYHAFQNAHRRRLYALPNDEPEQNRDDMKHALTLLLMHNQAFYAPVHERLAAGGKVFDVGTGTGIWAIEVADKYPRSIVHGVDLSPIQPDYVPTNVFFAVDDFEDDWLFPTETFDFVHMRHTLFAVDDRPALLSRVFRHLRPGGYVEFQELLPQPLTVRPGRAGGGGALVEFFHHVANGIMTSPFISGGELLVAAAAESREQNQRRGQQPAEDGADADTVAGLDQTAAAASLYLPRTLSAELAAAGFRNIHTAVHGCPLGTWAASERLHGAGLLLRTALAQGGLRGWATRPLGSTAGGLGWSEVQIELFLVEVRRVLQDPDLRMAFPLHVVYAQKPQ